MVVRAAGTQAAAIKAGHREFLFPCVAPYYADPVVMARGDGMKVWDTDGREYLDFFSGILTTAIGHCHPEVLDRVQEQMAALGHTSTLYLTEGQVEMAQRLADIAPGKLRQTFFTNSGTEAIETAIVLASPRPGPGPAQEALARRGPGPFLLALKTGSLADTERWMLSHHVNLAALGSRADGARALVTRPEPAHGVWLGWVEQR